MLDNTDMEVQICHPLAAFGRHVERMNRIAQKGSTLDQKNVG
jgi:hypothetical protein